MIEFAQHILIIRSFVESLRGHIIQTVPQQELSKGLEDISISLDNLQLLEEQIQSSIEVMELIQEELISHSDYLAQKHHHYYDVFNLAPDAYLLADSEGVIVEANLRAVCLFKTLQQYLIGKPLVNFIPVKEHSIFRSLLKNLVCAKSVQEWEFSIQPRSGKLFDATLLVAPVRDISGKLESLRIIVRDITKYKQINNNHSKLSQAHIPLITTV